MNWRVVIQRSIKCHICLDGEHDWLSLGLLQLKESLPLRVPPEVLPLLVKTETSQIRLSHFQCFAVSGEARIIPFVNSHRP